MVTDRIDQTGIPRLSKARSPAYSKLLIGAQYPPAIISLFSTNLSYLLLGGIPLDAALRLTQQSECSSSFKKRIGRISESVQAGKMMSSAMREHANVFSEVSIALVEAAERDGTLGGTFTDIADLINIDAASRERLKQAMAYPFLLALAVSLTMVFMITYLTPAVKPLLQSVGAQPSFATQLLFFLADNGAIIVLLFAWVPALLFIVFVLTHFSAVAKIYWHRFVLRVWIIGGISRDLHYARLCRVVARLLSSGLHMDKAIAVASNSVDNLFVQRDLQRVRQRMQAGNSFSQSLACSSTAPMMLTPLMNAAESSGEVADALQRVSGQLDEQARLRLERFTALVPPMLVCVLGSILLALVAGLLAPIFSSALIMGAGI